MNLGTYIQFQRESCFQMIYTKVRHSISVDEWDGENVALTQVHIMYVQIATFLSISVT